MNERIVVENVNHPGKAYAVDAATYLTVRAAMLEALPATAPGMTLAELGEALAGLLPDGTFTGAAGRGWWSKTVQLDLEAKGMIVREHASPMRLHKAGAST